MNTKAIVVHDIRSIRIDQLRPWPPRQRDFNQKWGERIAANLDLNAIGLPLVVLWNGTYWVIDGQHRVWALTACGYGEKSVQCEVLSPKSEAEAMRAFYNRNQDLGMQAVEKFLAQVGYGDEDAVAIASIAASVGLEVNNQGHHNSIPAVKALQSVYRPRGTKEPQPEALRNALETIVAAWGPSRESLQGNVIVGIGQVFVRFNGQVNKNELRQKLAKFPGGPANLIGSARGARQLFGGTITAAVSEIVVAEYNKGRRTQRLPEWRIARRAS